jgi:hypothetical protein
MKFTISSRRLLGTFPIAILGSSSPSGVLKENPFLCGTRDYHTLIESLLVEPLKNLPVPSPVLIVSSTDWTRVA